MKKTKLQPGLMKACGKIAFPMTNDAMFHMVYNRNEKALTGFISSLLHIPVSVIKSVTITNPELFGDGADDKQYRLDINVLLNDETLIDIEMQILWDRCWENRALLYLCSNFASLKRGEDYSCLKQAIQVWIMNGMPKDRSSRFYSKYRMAEETTNEEFSDRIVIYMMDLKKINEATEEDLRWGIVDWAEFLAATTWEEIKMAATDNEYVAEAADTMLLLNSDYLAKKRAFEREIYIEHENYVKKQLAMLNETLETVKEQKVTLAKNKKEIAGKKTELSKLDAEIAKQKAALAEKDARIAELEAQIARMSK